MDIKELHSFKMSDAVKFHDKLNPNLWRNNHLDPAVRKQLIVIAEDFLSNMGISGLDVKDITVSGSSAAYSYTPHSDLDLHILVDMSKLPDDEVYKELFTAKKTIYNDSHDIKVKGVPVELYVQDSNQPIVSLGEYSILDDKWLKIPSKRRANLDQNATKAKYDKLAGLVDLALKSRNLERIKDTIKTIKRYRQAGLDTYGEFGPENLAYKAVRSQGAIDALYNLRDELHGEELSIEEMYSGPKMKFLRPGELKGSYSDYDLLRMGFKKSQNGSWYIPQTKWDKLVAAQQIGEEEDLAERYTKEFEGYSGNNPAIGKLKVLTSRDIRGKYTDDQLVAVGFKKEPTGNFTIPLLKWNKLRSTKKLEDTVSEDETMQYAAEKIAATNPYGGLEDNQFRGSISEAADKKISFKIQKGNGKFSTTLTVNDSPAGIYQYDSNTGRSIAEVYPEFKGKGLGKLLVLHAIYTAAQLGLDFQEDESRTSAYDNVLDSLSSNGYIVDDDGYWYVTGEGEQYLKQSLNEASGYIPSEKEKNDPRWSMALTKDVRPNAVKQNAKAFSWLTNRAGVPPQARPDGKVK